MRLRSEKGFSFVEMMVTTLIFSVMVAGSFTILSAGKNIWLVTDKQVQLKESLRKTLDRVSKELRESGKDKNGVTQVTIGNNTGVNGSDVLKFSIPICGCAVNVMDNNGDVNSWGAPLVWGTNTSNCAITSADDAGKTTICHIPPGNPNNPQTIKVGASAVNPHLAHGDYLGVCGGCPTTNYTFIQYLLNNNNQLLRQVLDSANAVVSSKVFALNVTSFQASQNGDLITLTATASGKTDANQQLSASGSMDIFLRNE